MQTSPFIVGVDYKAIFLSPQTEREQDPDDIDIEPSRGITTRSSRLNPKRQASQSVYRYSDDDSYLPPIFDDEQPDPNPTLPLLAFFEDDADSMNSTGNTGTKDQGDFQLFKPSTNADACSYDLRDQQEPPTVSKEYPNYGSSKDNTNSSDLYDVDTKKDIKSQLEAEPGPLCFQSVSPTPDSPSRLDTELHIHHHPDTKKPASSVTASPKDIKPTLPANLTINAAAVKGNNSSQKKAPSSTTSSAGSTSAIPVDPALAGSSSSNSNSMQQQPQSALSSYFDVSGMSNINNNGVNARPMQRAGQPSFLKDMGDGMIRTPGPGQMVSPKQTFVEPTSTLQNTASNTASKPARNPQVSESGPAWPTDAQMKAMVASIYKAHDEQQQQQKRQQQQQQQAQQTQQAVNNQNNIQQQQQVPYPFPNTFQVKPEALNTSTDIAVPSSSSINNNSATNSALPPLPTNYQPPPAPLNFQDGSLFSHQAILASLQAENDARLMNAMGQGNYGGFNAASYMPAFASTSTLGDVNVAQHFNQQQQASTSALSTPGNNTSDSSRKRGRGGNNKAHQQQQQDNQRQGLTRENSGSQQAPSSVRSTYDNNGDEPNPFHTDASAFFNLDGNGLGLDINGANSYNDQMQAAGIPIPQSSRTSTSRAAKKKSQQGADMGDFPVAGTSKVNNTQGSGATRSGAADEDPLHDSSFSTEEDDEWVAEDSDDSFGKPAKKKGKKLGAAWTPSTASTSNATKATKTKKSKKDNSNNNTTNTNSFSTATAVPPLPPASYSGFNFGPQFGADGMYIMPPALDHTPQQSPVQTSAKSQNGHSERNKPAAPGTGSIVCDYVDPATGYVCQVRFRRPYDQARHLETVHGVGNDAKPKSVCFTCHKSFSRKDALIRHGRISGHVTFMPVPPSP